MANIRNWCQIDCCLILTILLQSSPLVTGFLEGSTQRPITSLQDGHTMNPKFNTSKAAAEVGRTMSRFLDDILSNYDPNQRPISDDDPKKPTLILSDINVRSMGPISEIHRSYSMDCYFRQTWRDPRLQYTGPLKEMAVHIKLLERLWKPDTYFLNGKNSYVHMITTANKLLRIRQDGTILYSMRLTIKADCPMKLQAYPMDTQYCPLTILSFGHSDKTVIYQWKYGNNQSIVVSDDVKLSQFDIVSYPHTNTTTILRDAPYASLSVVFRLKRHMGYFLLQVYVPSILLVIMSWVTFWLNREATSDRAGLGITVILTMTTMTRDNGSALPQVPYATALDIYVQMCFIFLIFSMIELVGVHYFTKTGGGDHQVDDSDTEDENDLLTEEELKIIKEKEKKRKKTLKKSALAKGIKMMSMGIKEEKEDTKWRKLLSCLQGNHQYRNNRRKQARRLGGGANSVSKLDKIARYLFPSTFTILNIIYWCIYYFNDRDGS